MPWIIALLAVVVIGIAWIAGSGRLGGMPPLVDDRPGMDLPDTQLTSEDLRNVRLAVTVRGYSMAQVDALLDRLAKQLDAQPYEPVDAYDAWLTNGAPVTTDAPIEDATVIDADNDDDNEEAGVLDPGLSESLTTE